jgi:hypothetical protein
LVHQLSAGRPFDRSSQLKDFRDRCIRRTLLADTRRLLIEAERLLPKKKG